MLNIIALMGRLTAEPELRHTPNGIATCAFSIACERSYAAKDEQRKADFFDIVAWRQTAEFVCKYFHKGSLIAIDGALQARNYEDKNGNKRKVVEVVASNVHFGGSKVGNQDNSPPASLTSPPPRQASASPPAPENSRQSASYTPAQTSMLPAQKRAYIHQYEEFEELDANEDIPF